MTALTASELHSLADEPQPRCADCAKLWRHPGWESISGAMQVGQLQRVGTLVQEGNDRLDEFHPQGTQLWSPDAPIALGWHPYNRCTVWRCRQCAAAFLRYTEYGGYYEEERIRPLLPDLIVAPEG
ncbi:MAG: hypothetical protein QM740_01165 [Acidovorax sp.]